MQQVQFEPPSAGQAASIEGSWQGAVAFVLCALSTFGLGFSAFLLLPKYLTELGAGAQTIGAMTSAMSVAVVLTTPVSAYLVGRWERRSLVRLAAASLGLSSLAFLAVPEPGAMMIALRCAQGSAFSLMLTACSVTVLELSPPLRLGRLLGFVGAAMLGTQALAPAVIEPLTEWLGWSALFWGGAGASVLVAFSSFGWPQPQPMTGSEPREPPAPFRLQGMLRPCLVASMATGFSFGAVVTFAPAFALLRGASSVSPLFLGYTALALGVRILVGGLGDAWGHARVAVGSVAVYAAVVFCFAGLQPGLLPVLGAGLGLAHGLLFPSLNVLAIGDTPVAQRGRVQSFFFGAFHLGVAASGLALGGVAVAVGFPAAFGFAGAISMAAAGYLALAVRRRTRAAEPSSA